MEEIERCWCAVGDTGDAAWREMRERATLGATTLRFDAERTLDDRLFDTDEGGLGQVGLTLRLRSTPGAAWVTVKGPSIATADGTLTRPEWEASADRQSLVQALARVADWGGPTLALGVEPADAAAGSDVGRLTRELAALGLHPRHRRRTRRLTRAVHLPAGPRVAELAVDEVEFATDAGAIVHREVELELARAGAREGFETAGAVIEGEGRLRPWPVSKTALGKALALLAAGGRLGSGALERGRLTSAGYDLLARSIG